MNKNIGDVHIKYLYIFRSGCSQKRNRSSKDIIGRREDTEDTGYVTITILFIV